MKYPLYNLNDEEFENLVAIICQKILGTGAIIFSAGKDGGRDAKFNGSASKFPSEASPWNGKIIIQAKHTSKPTASCTDSDFKTILKHEIPKISKLKSDNKIDYYLLFTNRKLSGLQDPKIEDLINEECGVTNYLIGLEQIHLWLKEYYEIPKMLGLNKLLLPFDFYEKDIQEVVLAFSKTNIPKAEIEKINIGITRIPIEDKNHLNNLSKEYFDNVFKKSYSDFEKIKVFLEDPINDEYKVKYDNTINDLQEEIIIKWDEYNAFEDILNHIYKLILDVSSDTLRNKRRFIRVFLHYMYYYCDIGKKKETKC